MRGKGEPYKIRTCSSKTRATWRRRNRMGKEKVACHPWGRHGCHREEKEVAKETLRALVSGAKNLFVEKRNWRKTRDHRGIGKKEKPKRRKEEIN